MGSEPAGGGGADASGPASFQNLIGLASGTLATDLLNVLRSVAGFGSPQGDKSGSTVDLTSDTTKHGVGQINSDQIAQNAVKSILKPHDGGGT